MKNIKFTSSLIFLFGLCLIHSVPSSALASNSQTLSFTVAQGLCAGEYVTFGQPGYLYQSCYVSDNRAWIKARNWDGEMGGYREYIQASSEALLPETYTGTVSMSGKGRVCTQHWYADDGSYGGCDEYSDYYVTNETLTIDVTLKVVDNIGLSKESISARTTQSCGAVSETLAITNPGPGKNCFYWWLSDHGYLSYDVTSDKEWMALTFDGFYSGQHFLDVGKTGIVKVTFNPAGLNPGSYNGAVTVKSGKVTKQIPVTFTVNPSEEICGDGIDNNCNGQIDEECKKEKELEYVSGSGQEGLICEELKEPLVEKVVDSQERPQSNIAISWEIIEQPAGAAAYLLTNPSPTTKTASDGLATAFVKLGKLAGEYVVQSTCDECTEGSPLKFTMTATCPEIVKYSQGDPAWADNPYDNWCKYLDPVTKNTNKRTCEWENDKLKPGYTQYTISEKGCALTSLAMVLERYGSKATPPIWNDFLKAINGYAPRGNIDWNVPTYIDSLLSLTFSKKSIDDDTPLSNVILDDYLNRCMPAIVKVKHWYQKKDGTRDWGFHWIVVTGKSNDYYIINDPGFEDGKDLSVYENEIYAIQIYKKEKEECQ